MLLHAGSIWQASLLIVTDAAFVGYSLALTAGVAIVLHAVRPRFNVPTTWKPEGSRPGSYLFFAKIIEVSPADWASAFVNSRDNELLAAYVKNSVLETYLIAEKVALKVKWLTRGVRLLFASTIILAILVSLVVTTLALVPEKVNSGPPSGSSPSAAPAGRASDQRSVPTDRASQARTSNNLDPAKKGSESSIPLGNSRR